MQWRELINGLYFEFPLQSISPGQWLFLLAWQSILMTVPSGGYKRFPLPHAAGYKTNDTANSFSAVCDPV